MFSPGVLVQSRGLSSDDEGHSSEKCVNLFVFDLQIIFNVWVSAI